MKTIITLSIAALLSVSTNSMAATVEYQHPGLTILAGGDGSAVANVSANPSHAQSVEQTTSVPVAVTGNPGAGAAAAPSDHAPPMVEDDTAMAEHEARMETERLEHAARMVEEQAAQEVRMKEEVARHDAELEAELAAEGLLPPQ